MKKSLEELNKKANRNVWLIPLAIFLIALSVRVIGLKFSFPLLTHFDERAIIDPLIEMSKNHTLDSGQYNRPNHVLYTTLFGYLNLISKVLFNKNFGWAYEENPLFFYYHARLVVAIFGAFVPVLAWKIGKLFKEVDFSLPAAFLTCFYAPYVVHSHYITGDIINTAFSLATILLCLIYLQKKKQGWLILASVTVALNTLEKYPGILSYGIILFTLGISAFSQENNHRRFDWVFFFRHSLITLAIVILSMFIFAPHLFFRLNQIRDVLIYESRSTHLGADNLNWLGNMQFYVKNFIDASGWIFAIFGLAGIIFAILSREPSMLLLFFGAGYWIALSRLGLHWERWSLPMVITPLLLAAYSIAKLWANLKHNKMIRILLTIFFAVSFSIYSLNGLNSSIVLTWQDTRAKALQFTTINNINQTNTVSEGYSPFLPRYANRIFNFDYQNPGQTHYVILSSNIYGRYEADPDRYFVENNYYNGLRASSTLIAEFKPSKKPINPKDQFVILIDYISNLITKITTSYTTGPTIQIYQLP